MKHIKLQINLKGLMVVVAGILILLTVSCSNSSHDFKAIQSGSVVEATINSSIKKEVTVETTQTAINVTAQDILSVDADGTGSRQWYKIENGERVLIPGETDEAIELTNTKLTDAGLYRLIISKDGSELVAGSVELIVIPKLIITETNVQNRRVLQGSNLNLFAIAKGPEVITYEWYFSADNTIYTPLNESSFEFSVTGFSTSNEGFYKVIATSTQGGFLQTAEVTPGQILISLISGTINGPTQVVEGTPVNLQGLVSDQSLDIIWSKNGEALNTIGDELIINNAPLNAAGTYTISTVTEDGAPIILAEHTVNVICSEGVEVNGECKPEAIECTEEVTNGFGFQFLNDNGEFEGCVIQCNPGFELLDGECVPILDSELVINPVNPLPEVPSCDGIKIFNASGQCVCPAPFEENENGACVEPAPQCEVEGAVIIDELTHECACPEGTRELGGRCSEIKECPGNFTMTDEGVCGCEEGFMFNEEGDSCVPQPELSRATLKLLKVCPKISLPGQIYGSFRHANNVSGVTLNVKNEVDQIVYSTDNASTISGFMDRGAIDFNGQLFQEGRYTIETLSGGAPVTVFPGCEGACTDGETIRGTTITFLSRVDTQTPAFIVESGGNILTETPVYTFLSSSHFSCKIPPPPLQGEPIVIELANKARNKSVLDAQHQVMELSNPFIDPVMMDLIGSRHEDFRYHTDTGLRSLFSEYFTGKTDIVSKNAKLPVSKWSENTKSRYAFLALPNSEGKVLGVDQLFGDTTTGPDGTGADNGYDALAKHDLNRDGKIDNKDSIFNKLALWVDHNDNGVSDDGELKSITSQGIASISLNYDKSSFAERDLHESADGAYMIQNTVNFKSTVEYENGQMSLSFDLWYQSPVINENFEN